MAKTKMGNKGQGAIEALLALPLLLGAFTLILTLGYHASLYALASYYAEETLFCMAREENTTPCTRALQKRVSRFLIWPSPVKVQGRMDSQEVELEIAFERIHFQRQLKLPLEKNRL